MANNLREFTEDEDFDCRMWEEKCMRPRFKNGINLVKLMKEGISFEVDTEEAEDFFDGEDNADQSFTTVCTDQLSNPKNSKLKSIYGNITLEDVGGDYEDLAGKMENVTPDGGVKKLIVKGGFGKDILEGSKVYMHYVAICEGCDEPYDSTLTRGRSEIVTLGDANLIPGLYLAVGSMKVEEVAKFIVSSEYGYGDQGCPPRIPPKSRILYIVEIVDMVPAEQLSNILHKSVEERGVMEFSIISDEACKLRMEGNSFYTQSKYSVAVRRYHNGVRILEDYPVVKEADERTRNDLLFSFYINLAQAYLKLEKAPQACVASRRALRLENLKSPVLYKAYFRFANAKYLLGNYDEAKKLCLKAERLEPKNSSIKNLLLKIERNLTTDQAKLNKLYKDMFSYKSSVDLPRKDTSDDGNSDENLKSSLRVAAKDNPNLSSKETD